MFLCSRDLSKECKNTDCTDCTDCILDKIRTEIMKLQTYKMFIGEDTVYVKCNDLLKLIDKYRNGE